MNVQPIIQTSCDFEVFSLITSQKAKWIRELRGHVTQDHQPDLCPLHLAGMDEFKH